MLTGCYPSQEQQATTAPDNTKKATVKTNVGNVAGGSGGNKEISGDAE